MKVYRWQLILFWTCVLLSGAFPFSNSACAEQEQANGAEQALELAREDPRVKDILADFPQIKMMPSYSERFDVWVIEFLIGDREAGIAKWGKPIAGASYLLFCLLIGFVPGRMNMRRLVALTAAVLVGTQFTLSHGGGTYIGFYIAAFIILLFGPSDYPQPKTAQSTREKLRAPEDS